MGLQEELARLAELHQAGALTDEEFSRAKASVLGGRDEASRTTPDDASNIGGRRRPTWSIALLAVLLVAGVAAGATAFLTGDSGEDVGGNDVGFDSTPDTIAASGKVTITPVGRGVENAFSVYIPPDDESTCSGGGPNEGIEVGAPVTFYDQSSAIIGTGRLRLGEVQRGDEAGNGEFCTFIFQVPGLPADRTFYQVSVAGRNKVSIDKDDLGSISLGRS